VSGALAERVFAAKLRRVGFADVWIGEKVPYGIDQAALYPLFSSELVQLMRRLISRERQGRVAISVIVKAEKPYALTAA
jgi:arsenite methyltransferase